MVVVVTGNDLIPPRNFDNVIFLRSVGVAAIVSARSFALGAMVGLLFGLSHVALQSQPTA